MPDGETLIVCSRYAEVSVARPEADEILVDRVKLGNHKNSATFHLGALDCLGGSRFDEYTAGLNLNKWREMWLEHVAEEEEEPEGQQPESANLEEGMQGE
jgi:hypothetical protein